MNSRRLLLYLPPFVVLAVLNSGGYRYGASDQAFYLPVILAKLDPGLYVRDAAVIAAQARLTIYDEVIAAIVQSDRRIDPGGLFAVLHVVSLVLVGDRRVAGREAYLPDGVGRVWHCSPR